MINATWGIQLNEVKPKMTSTDYLSVLALFRAKLCLLSHNLWNIRHTRTVQPQLLDRSKFYWEKLSYIYLYSFISILLSHSWLLAAPTLPVMATIHTQIRHLDFSSISSCTEANCLSSVSQDDPLSFNYDFLSNILPSEVKLWHFYAHLTISFKLYTILCYILNACSIFTSIKCITNWLSVRFFFVSLPVSVEIITKINMWLSF